MLWHTASIKPCTSHPKTQNGCGACSATSALRTELPARSAGLASAAGISGTSQISGRKADTFGIAYFYLGVSEPLKELAPLLLPLRNEYGVELYYNVAITPWCQITPDIQVISPFRDRPTLRYSSAYARTSISTKGNECESLVDRDYPLVATRHSLSRIPLLSKTTVLPLPLWGTAPSALFPPLFLSREAFYRTISLPHWWEFVIRAVVVYLFMVVLLRLTGKRQVWPNGPLRPRHCSWC